MKSIAFFFAFAMVTFCSAQAQIKVLSSFEDSDGLGDYSSFDVLSEQLKEVKVVGMGESTHGTSEFFGMRLKMFRYLVEQHQFTTLYLEDEYATCLELNKYIQGQNHSCEEYVAQLSNWPWKTHEFVEVMNWMRRHNELYPEHQVRIVGVDMQDYQPAFEALDRLFTRHGMNTHFGKDTVVTDVSRGLLKDHTLKHLDSLTTEAKVVLNKLVLNEADSLQGITLLRHLEQSRTASQRYERSFRDVQMAENLLRDLNLKEDRKGFFWAHNGHVCNLRYQRNKKKPIVYWAGGKLREQLGNAYFVVLQDFAQGSFNAYHLKAHHLDKEEFTNYNLGEVELGWESEKFFAFGHHPGNTSELMTVDLLKPRKKYIRFHSIGAEYTPKNLGGSGGRGHIYLEPHYYNCVLLVARSTPSHLLSTK